MNTVGQMLYTHPEDPEGIGAKAAACVRACEECARACTTCADACLGEEAVAELVACIRADLDCADLCAVTGRAVSQGVGRDDALLRLLLEACAAACRRCGDECERQEADHAHCRACAEACRRCERACTELLGVL
ncbi:four-helix bundle copper-binding protein [Nocardiopsis sp. CT-R113]|uniref:Four-helix bundle copper-binding protein n=1 Tax=Nocardiopsis codii TaxID=3065942 RepID=A0ABU7K728_9ACTN|nr:four-helix bundle copper-binding protein [Nocardiopsis sp. CT-R113]MEE2038057.1 four-helix bundle copper-binding protein [Nocardiopsis sp. CT-R113]